MFLVKYTVMYKTVMPFSNHYYIFYILKGCIFKVFQNPRQSNVRHLVRWQVAKLQVRSPMDWHIFTCERWYNILLSVMCLRAFLTLVKLTYTNKSMYCETRERWLWVADKEMLNKDRSLTKHFAIKFINNINKQQFKIHKNHFAVFDTSLLINQ